MSTTVYVSIGNSDNKLHQHEWAQFVDEVHMVMHMANTIHGAWYSSPVAPWQNACWCIEFTDNNPVSVALVRKELFRLAKRYRQESIAWAVAPETEFLAPDES